MMDEWTLDDLDALNQLAFVLEVEKLGMVRPTPRPIDVRRLAAKLKTTGTPIGGHRPPSRQLPVPVKKKRPVPQRRRIEERRDQTPRATRAGRRYLKGAIATVGGTGVLGALATRAGGKGDPGAARRKPS